MVQTGRVDFSHMDSATFGSVNLKTRDKDRDDTAA